MTDVRWEDGRNLLRQEVPPSSLVAPARRLHQRVARLDAVPTAVRQAAPFLTCLRHPARLLVDGAPQAGVAVTSSGAPAGTRLSAATCTTGTKRSAP